MYIAGLYILQEEFFPYQFSFVCNVLPLFAANKNILKFIEPSPSRKSLVNKINMTFIYLTVSTIELKTIFRLSLNINALAFLVVILTSW